MREDCNPAHHRSGWIDPSCYFEGLTAVGGGGRLTEDYLRWDVLMAPVFAVFTPPSVNPVTSTPAPGFEITTNLFDSEGNLLDKTVTSGTFTPAPIANTAITILQTGLDVMGLVPGIGEFADGLNASIYAGRGDWTNAAISGAALIPLGGQSATVTRLAEQVLEWLGPGATRITNTTSRLGIRGTPDATGAFNQIRFDLDAPWPHVNIETHTPRNAFPGDERYRVTNDHVFIGGRRP